MTVAGIYVGDVVRYRSPERGKTLTVVRRSARLAVIRDASQTPAFRVVAVDRLVSNWSESDK